MAVAAQHCSKNNTSCKGADHTMLTDWNQSCSIGYWVLSKIIQLVLNKGIVLTPRYEAKPHINNKEGIMPISAHQSRWAFVACLRQDLSFVKEFPYISSCESFPLVLAFRAGDMTYRSDFVRKIDLEVVKWRRLEVLLGYKCQILFIVFCVLWIPEKKMYEVELEGRK